VASNAINGRQACFIAATAQAALAFTLTPLPQSSQIRDLPYDDIFGACEESLLRSDNDQAVGTAARGPGLCWCSRVALLNLTRGVYCPIQEVNSVGNALRP
jgi:hypothetical protein